MFPYPLYRQTEMLTNYSIGMYNHRYSCRLKTSVISYGVQLSFLSNKPDRTERISIDHNDTICTQWWCNETYLIIIIIHFTTATVRVKPFFMLSTGINCEKGLFWIVHALRSHSNQCTPTYERFLNVTMNAEDLRHRCKLRKVFRHPRTNARTTWLTLNLERVPNGRTAIQCGGIADILSYQSTDGRTSKQRWWFILYDCFLNG